MAQIPLPKNPLSVLRKFREEFESRTNISNFESDSKARAITDVLVDEVLALREESLMAFYANQVSNATGTDLDALGLARGLSRFKEQLAQSQDLESNVFFYLESGADFGTVNSSADIIIPDGTVISSEPNSNESGESIDYLVVGNHILLADSSIGFVSVRAKFAGSKSNVGTQVLNTHDFINYTQASLGLLKVVNSYSIINGRDIETDEAYRFRLSQHYQSLLQNNNSRILLRSLEVPGVINARPISGYFGIGTVGVIVNGAEGQSNPRLLGGVQGKLDNIKGPGLTMSVVSATQVSFDFELQVKLSKAISQVEQKQLEGVIRRICANFFSQRSAATSINLDSLALKIQEDSGGIVSLGSLGSNSLFKNVYIRTGVAGASIAEREVLLTQHYTLADDEFPALGTLAFEFI